MGAVRGVLVVLGPVVDAHVQPRHPRAARREPHGPAGGGEPVEGGGGGGAQDGAGGGLRRCGYEAGEVRPVGGGGGSGGGQRRRARRDEYGVAAEVGEGDGGGRLAAAAAVVVVASTAAVAACGKVLLEGAAVRSGRVMPRWRGESRWRGRAGVAAMNLSRVVADYWSMHSNGELAYSTSSAAAVGITNSEASCSANAKNHHRRFAGEGRGPDKDDGKTCLGSATWSSRMGAAIRTNSNACCSIVACDAAGVSKKYARCAPGRPIRRMDSISSRNTTLSRRRRNAWPCDTGICFAPFGGTSFTV